MATIKEIQEQIIDDFSFLPEWEERYAYLIELGQNSEPLPEKYHTEEYIVRGCQSLVWLHLECKQGEIFLQADSDSLIVKGLAALLTRVFSGQPAKNVVETDLSFFEEMGINQHLSSQRTNGLMSMVEKIKVFAAQCG